MWFLGTITLFYVFVGSLFWELLFRVKHFKTWWRGGIIYFLLGTIYGGLAITVVTFTIGETEAMGWIFGMGMMGVAAFVFYMVRKVPVYKT